MKCKYCDATLEEGMTVCPECGKEQETMEETVLNAVVEQEMEEETKNDAEVEETTEEIEEEQCELDEEPAADEKVKLAWWKVLLISVGMLAVVLLLVGLILKSQGVDINPAHWFDKSTQSIEESYNLKRDDYTASAEDMEGQAAKLVAKSGDIEMDNALLQLYYWNGVYEFVNNYQYYLESFGLDLTKPFNEQMTVSNTTWQQFFVENAIFNWHKFSALAHEAEKADFKLSAETEDILATMEEEMETYAKSAGYESAIDMLQVENGGLVTMEAYLKYCREFYTAKEYFEAEYAKMQPTDEQIEAYFTENEESLAASGITKQKQTYDVRHILIEPEGGTDNGEGMPKTYTDIEWGACQAAAQELLDQWKSGAATEESFAELAKTHSTDGGSSADGGLYPDLDASTNFVQEFKDWYLDENRKVGDTGLVKSVYGYHIMYFSGTETIESDWKAQCTNLIMEKASADYVDEIMRKWSIKVYDKNIAIGEASLLQGQ